MPLVPGSPSQRARLERLMHRVGIGERDVEERFIRSSGPGGQRVNKTATCVVLRHRSTGLEVRCQAERFQVANRYLAWSKLLERVEQQRRERAQAERQRVEAIRRQHRRKPQHVNARMVADKRHRAQKKALRGRVQAE